jgi:hypothetical protein
LWLAGWPLLVDSVVINASVLLLLIMTFPPG